MKEENVLVTKASAPEVVDEFMSQLKHPMYDVAVELRQLILAAEKKIGEEIFWNAPCFFYTGKMKPFKPKEYKRYIVGFNLFKKDCVRLIFLRGAFVEDESGLLEGDYTDGRRLAVFYSMEDVKTKEKDLKKILKEIIKLIEADK